MGNFMAKFYQITASRGKEKVALNVLAMDAKSAIEAVKREWQWYEIDSIIEAVFVDQATILSAVKIKTQ